MRRTGVHIAPLLLLQLRRRLDMGGAQRPLAHAGGGSPAQQPRKERLPPWAALEAGGGSSAAAAAAPFPSRAQQQALAALQLERERVGRPAACAPSVFLHRTCCWPCIRSTCGVADAVQCLLYST